MKYSLFLSENVKKKFEKMRKKKKEELEAIGKKIEEILENPHRFEPLKGDMKGSFRIHIKKSFVLVYEIEEKNKAVRILEYAHHDEVY